MEMKKFEVSTSRSATNLVAQENSNCVSDIRASEQEACERDSGLQIVVLYQLILFYEFDDISSGKKDFVSIREGESGYMFEQSEGSVQKVCFSKFAELRPRNCILAGTHSVCVCTILYTIVPKASACESTSCLTSYHNTNHQGVLRGDLITLLDEPTM